MSFALGMLALIAAAVQDHSYIDLQMNGHRYHVEVAQSALKQATGLGGRERLATSDGMLFVFDAPAVHCFWMKDMSFSIDIIWLDSRRLVTHIESNVSPKTYPHSFCPTQPSQYVIELAAGQAQQTNLHPGQQLSW